MMGWEYVDHTYTNLCIHMCVYIYTHAVCKYIYMYVSPTRSNPIYSPCLRRYLMTLMVGGWCKISNLYLVPINTLLYSHFMFIYIHACIHTKMVIHPRCFSTSPSVLVCLLGQDTASCNAMAFSLCSSRFTPSKDG